jgi:hypothetical protein
LCVFSDLATQSQDAEAFNHRVAILGAVCFDQFFSLGALVGTHLALLLSAGVGTALRIFKGLGHLTANWFPSFDSACRHSSIIAYFYLLCIQTRMCGFRSLSRNLYANFNCCILFP